ncbi:exported hypothetical protein [Actinacidiphila cocklensis]|uniref:Ricin B lectin domain-containing protein n=2 Tax=Actinacidiphila cocklensis TaxID=887465 RepID=A0A9W4GSF9_9ACTN|nr:exported hypothetical protein [Actinacidiphila cocklensis]
MLGRLLAVTVAAITATTVSMGTAGAEDGWIPTNDVLYPLDGKRIQNLHSNLCLIPYGGSDTPGANIVQFDCNGSNYEKWFLWQDEIVNVGSGLCLTPEGGWSGNNVKITQWDCATNMSQLTRYQHPWLDDHGYNFNWQEVLLGTGYCLTVEGAWTTREAQITQYDCDNESPAQYWHAIND